MLTKQQLQDIKKLQKECEVHDDIQLKLNWSMLENRDSDQLDFFYYENDKLVAFLGLYPFGSTVEVCGMVNPSKRRKRHFHRLFQQGMEAVKKYKYNKILLNTPAESSAAKEFLFKIGANYSFSEHQMVCQKSLVEPVEGITLRQAKVDDVDMSIRISIEAFGMTREEATSMERSFHKERQTDMLMIDVNGKTVGNFVFHERKGKRGFMAFPSCQNIKVKDLEGKCWVRSLRSKVQLDIRCILRLKLRMTKHLDYIKQLDLK